MEDLDSFRSELAVLLRTAPADCLPLFEEATAEVLASLRLKVPGETGEMEETKTKRVEILLTSKEDPVSILSLRAQFISKLVKISGIVISASRTKAKATHVTLVCKNCRTPTELKDDKIMGLISGIFLGVVFGVAVLAGWQHMMKYRSGKRISKAVDMKLLASLTRDDLKKMCGGSYPEWISFPVF